MRMLTSPIHYMRKKRARRKQIRTVLRMLSVSGVVRPGHVEPRYCEPLSQIDTLYRQETNNDMVLAINPQQPLSERSNPPAFKWSSNADASNPGALVPLNTSGMITPRLGC
jgi:hypothetical protein